MSRIINIIKDRHLGDFEDTYNGATRRCIRACDYKVFFEDDDGDIDILSAMDDEALLDGSLKDEIEYGGGITPIYTNITLSVIEEYAKAEALFDLRAEPADNDVLEDYREMVRENIMLAPDHPTISPEVREALGLPEPRLERIR